VVVLHVGDRVGDPPPVGRPVELRGLPVLQEDAGVLPVGAHHDEVALAADVGDPAAVGREPPGVLLGRRVGEAGERELEAAQPPGLGVGGAGQVEVVVAPPVGGQEQRLPVRRPGDVLLPRGGAGDAHRGRWRELLLLPGADRGDEHLAVDHDGGELPVGAHGQLVGAVAGHPALHPGHGGVGGRLDGEPAGLTPGRIHHPDAGLELVGHEGAVGGGARGAHVGAVVVGELDHLTGDQVHPEHVLAARPGGEEHQIVVVEPAGRVVVAVEVRQPYELAVRGAEPQVAVGGAAVAAPPPLGAAPHEDEGVARGGVGRREPQCLLRQRRGTASDGHRVQRWHPADGLVAPRGEQHRLAVRRDVARHVVHRGEGEPPRGCGPVGGHHVDVEVAVAGGGEGDPPSVPGPYREPVLGGVGGEPGGAPPARGHDPQVPLPGEGDPAAVGRGGRVARELHLHRGGGGGDEQDDDGQRAAHASSSSGRPGRARGAGTRRHGARPPVRAK